ncbi:MAG TPA: NAD(P)-binding domain-containing protein [Planctomycetota bacterium]|nr:NAD(P)-binding domain-containing protein [Planctomycetota bacterium]
MKAKVAIIGKGNVGSAIMRGLERVGYDVRAVGKEPGRARETAAWGDMLILAVPFAEIDNSLAEIGNAVNGKTLIDVTNPLTPDYQLAVGCTTSGAEELQKKAPRAKVVKAFNTVFAQNMATGQVKGTKLTFFAAGDDEGAKREVLEIGRALGFEPVDAGPLEHARWLETLGYFNIQLGYTLKMGTDIGFKVVGVESAPSAARVHADRSTRKRS